MSRHNRGGYAPKISSQNNSDCNPTIMSTVNSVKVAGISEKEFNDLLKQELKPGEIKSFTEDVLLAQVRTCVTCASQFEKTCRFNPPVMLPGESVAIFPLIKPDMYCGQWSAQK